MPLVYATTNQHWPNTPKCHQHQASTVEYITRAHVTASQQQATANSSSTAASAHALPVCGAPLLRVHPEQPELTSPNAQLHSSRGPSLCTASLTCINKMTGCTSAVCTAYATTLPMYATAAADTCSRMQCCCRCIACQHPSCLRCQPDHLQLSISATPKQWCLFEGCQFPAQALQHTPGCACVHTCLPHAMSSPTLTVAQ